MPTIFDVDTNKLVQRAAQELKKLPEIRPPQWATFVKTGAHKQRPPVQEDWWYIRAASVLRSVRVLGPIGVSKLRRKYGGRKNKGHKPERFVKGSGNIIRKILQQLEKAGLIAKTEKGIHKGKVIAPKGVSFLDKLAVELYKQQPKRGKPAKQEATEENNEEN
jgi:small subunit ribosomal protein S19e